MFKLWLAIILLKLINNSQRKYKGNLYLVFGNQMKNCSFLHQIPNFSFSKMILFEKQYHILTQCFITRWNTSNFVKNTLLQVAFL